MKDLATGRVYISSQNHGKFCRLAYDNRTGADHHNSFYIGMGGQAGLNLGMELEESGFLAAHGVTLLGTT